jgi:tetratricopeptide (TPR) repeat protein
VQAPPAATAPARPATTAPAPTGFDSPLEDDDLRAITAALEQELFASEDTPIVPAEEGEQSIEEIFATFKEHVNREVATDDHRTHYDLGIAYKEMGLTDEAIREFEMAAQTGDLHRDACSMIALCHRDRQDMAEAARWYREAIDSCGDESNVAGLRYDLAEVLLEVGDTQGALDQFRDVLRADPSFRDVRGRVSELESLLQA